GGRLRAMHCMDIPFIFDTTDECAAIVGTGSDRRALADRMSNAWVAFARTGNPNHSKLPKWEPFDADARQTMMLGNNCRMVNDPHREQRLAVADAQRRQP